MASLNLPSINISRVLDARAMRIEDDAAAASAQRIAEKAAI